jgi:uncharacterized protein YegP (UPF0339 family)
MSTHKIDAYKDAEGKWRWRIFVTPGTPGGTADDIVADSGQGYNNKQDMCKSFFGLFFGEYDDSFLALYNEWNPSSGQVSLDSDPPSVSEQAQPETAVLNNE